MDLAALEQALKEESKAKFIYTIPNFQNPSGITMSLEKRKNSISWRNNTRLSFWRIIHMVI